MKKRGFLLMLCVLFLTSVRGQSNNPVSIYEGERILSVHFEYSGRPADTMRFAAIRREVEDIFQIYPFSHFSRIQTD